MELKPSGYGIVVDKSNAKSEYPLNGLNFPLESGLNPESRVRDYCNNQMPANPSTRLILEQKYTSLYKEFNKKQKNKKETKKSFLEKIFD